MSGIAARSALQLAIEEALVCQIWLLSVEDRTVEPANPHDQAVIFAKKIGHPENATVVQVIEKMIDDGRLAVVSSSELSLGRAGIYQEEVFGSFVTFALQR